MDKRELKHALQRMAFIAELLAQKHIGPVRIQVTNSSHRSIELIVGGEFIREHLRDELTSLTNYIHAKTARTDDTKRDRQEPTG